MGGLFKRNKAPGLREQLFIAVHERSPSLAELCAQHESDCEVPSAVHTSQRYWGTLSLALDLDGLSW